MRLVCLALCVMTLPVAAQEPVVTLRATVTGNQEQPRVMYLLPWQQPGATDFEYAPARGLAQELFQRLDRDEFVRDLEYRRLLTRASAESGQHNVE